MIKQYSFYKTKYGDELLIDVIPLLELQPYIDQTPVHSLTYYDISIISEGQGTLSIDERSETVEKGRVYFSSPGQIRQWDVAEMPLGYALIFEEEFLCSFFNDALFVQNLAYFGASCSHFSIVLDKQEYDQLYPLLSNIYHEISSPQKDKHLLRALLYQVLILLNRMYLLRYPDFQPEMQNRHIQKFIKEVNSHYGDNRSVNFYAQKLNISSGHLSELVKQSIGISAKQYILDRTMLEAKRLLIYTEFSVDEIAQSLNFASTTYFVRIFHKNTGETPLQFKNSQIREK